MRSVTKTNVRYMRAQFVYSLDDELEGALPPVAHLPAACRRTGEITADDNETSPIRRGKYSLQISVRPKSTRKGYFGPIRPSFPNARRSKVKFTGFPFVLVVGLTCCWSSAAFTQAPSGQAEAGSYPQVMPLGQIRPMTVEIAKRLVAAARKASCSPPAGSCSGAFAVTDDAGVLVYLETIDGVLARGPELAIRKARTPALWRRPTKLFQDAVNNKTNTAYADGSFEDMTTSPGGIPIVRDGRIVGGFGFGGVGNAGKQVLAAVEAEAQKAFGKQ